MVNEWLTGECVCVRERKKSVCVCVCPPTVFVGIGRLFHFFLYYFFSMLPFVHLSVLDCGC